ncbi:sensor histidine kinase [Paenibacillus sp. GCM10027628]|uniref:cache domain-containing sensor histidine kinase n=1 Tax=Paenibacillus sp. GCM10027628 TaxID=3273413 RepID=UPI00362D1FC5
MLKFKDLPLIIKLYLCIAVLIIVPLIVLGLYLNSQFAALTLNKSSEIALQTLKQTKQNFESLFVDTNDISTRILSNGLVQEFAKGEYNKELDYDKIVLNMNSWLDDVVGSKKYYRSINLYLGKEVIFQKGVSVPDLDQSAMERALQEQGRGFWLTGPGKIAYYRGIMDFRKMGRMIAVERLDINEEILYEFYKNINSYEGSHIFLLDANGIVLSSTERNKIGDKIDDFDFVHRNILTKNGYFTADIENARQIVLFYTIEQSNWTMVQIIPEKSFTLLKSTINTVLLIVIVLCLIFGILFSFILHKYLLRPLLQLRKEMMKLKTGNFNIALRIDSKDEIGEISNGFLRMVEQLKETINDVYLTKIKQREAEIKALESQINPHFLYNTLDSIHWLAIRQKNYDVSEQIEALAEIFRHVLNKGEPFVTIGQEVDFLENYMFIQKRKYGERIKLHIDAAPDLMNNKMPKLVLQPLVENAIFHGLEQVVEGGIIEVKITRADQGIRLMVTDNGMGNDETKIHKMMSNIEEAKHVFALKNIDDRIKTSYGEPFGLYFTSKVGVGTKVEVLIPLIV